MLEDDYLRNSSPEDQEMRSNLPPQLYSAVNDFRKAVEIAWDTETVYPSSTREGKVGRFNALGQCAPTARLLKDVLLVLNKNGDFRCISGNVVNSVSGHKSSNHVWIELPQKNDEIVIDVTPNQVEAFGEKSPPVIIGLKSELIKEGFIYTSEHEDSDEIMRQSKSRSFDRYTLLKQKYQAVEERREYYEELFHRNIFIISPVGAGKTELLKRLHDELPLKTIDVGKLFRIVAYAIFNDDEEIGVIHPNIALLKKNDVAEIDRVVGGTFRKGKLIERTLLDETKLVSSSDGKSEIFFRGLPPLEDLESDNINTLVPAIAKSPKVRELVWKWINGCCNNNGGIVLTGHTLRDIDTTKFRILELTVNEETAAKRLRERSPKDYFSLEDAIVAVRQRNELDHIQEAHHLLRNAYGAETIDTTNLTPDEVANVALEKLSYQAEQTVKKRNEQKELELKREDFVWETNPLLVGIRTWGRGVFEDVSAIYKARGITEFDVAIQTMIHLAGLPPERIWKGKSEMVSQILDNVKLRNTIKAAEALERAIGAGEIELDLDLIRQEALRQAEALVEIHKHSSVVIGEKEIPLPVEYMGNPDNSPFGFSETKINTKGRETITSPDIGLNELIVREISSSKKIVFKKVIPEVSELYGKGFHYLHVGRKDELSAYGAYVEGDELPFAWVSYSLVDREYKKEMLNYLEVEPQRMVEMTRAWNSTWSPKNTMSVLFTFAHEQLGKQWKDGIESGEKDKPLAGVITAINGNLGFHANAFTGIGFDVVGLKPANLTYYKDKQNNLTYMSRRKLVDKLGLHDERELSNNPNFESNKFPLLPTYEMVLLFEKTSKDKLAQRPIYRIPDDDYHKT